MVQPPARPAEGRINRKEAHLASVREAHGFALGAVYVDATAAAALLRLVVRVAVRAVDCADFAAVDVGAGRTRRRAGVRRGWRAH